MSLSPVEVDRGDGGGGDIVAEINVTPLTDIFLVLLIIFMVTSTALTQQGTKVNLPRAGAGGAEPSGVMITATADHRIELNGKPVPAGCTVVFIHQEKTVPASGAVGADGSYSASQVLAGANKVSISPPAKASAAAAADPSNPEAYKAMMMAKGTAGAKGGTEEKPPFPAKYQSPETSGLTFTVKEGPNTFDIDLKDGR